ncbi:hypothetical protein AO366_0268 [Moraxella catarrhalis]|uniref:Uncharacterized protein n=1 Tax=Moraxella catarrhalis TaxID=480 RepID=A0A198XDV6_MORCA|nr:hypothetical protein AO382_1735 [Moraxella catarrhalis]OAV05094.1 hypothetical protein AO381_0498 [Moraxella catarrhalis]OAV07523.1 hypothetical protein AO379_0056 [Moraxella catarrhalis]OAV07656.1 hypothetical protein AO380_1059 [Moraxella catarrhalis]OAV09417.1 hypothetical protein AO378_1096 [Moraxella catarrhalis]
MIWQIFYVNKRIFLQLVTFICDKIIEIKNLPKGYAMGFIHAKPMMTRSNLWEFI